MLNFHIRKFASRNYILLYFLLFLIFFFMVLTYLLTIKRFGEHGGLMALFLCNLVIAQSVMVVTKCLEYPRNATVHTIPTIFYSIVIIIYFFIILSFILVDHFRRSTNFSYVFEAEFQLMAIAINTLFGFLFYAVLYYCFRKNADSKEE